MVQTEKHTSYGINFDMVYSMIEGEYTTKRIIDYLKKLTKSAKPCAACGGIQPELYFVFKDRTYRFVCYEMTNEFGEIVAETDYEQFGKWCAYHQRKEQAKK